jgi:thiamine phosphate synthase YjbQ (UPF0047 family)
MDQSREDEPRGEDMEVLIKTVTMEVEAVRGIQFFDLTHDIERCLTGAGIKNGLSVISTPYKGTGLFFSATSDTVLDDVAVTCGRLVAKSGGGKNNGLIVFVRDQQNRTSPSAMLIGSILALRVEEGCLVLGPCQRIMFADLGSGGLRLLRLQFMGEGPPVITEQHSDDATSMTTLSYQGGLQ